MWGAVLEKTGDIHGTPARNPYPVVHYHPARIAPCLLYNAFCAFVLIPESLVGKGVTPTSNHKKQCKYKILIDKHIVSMIPCIQFQ